MDLTGKVVVVTGGASGIGRALARRFADEGARGVAVADIDADGARAVAEQIAASGGEAIGVGCDVSEAARVEDLISQSERAYGPVDLFCANAGIGQGTGLDTPDDVWEQAFDVNVRAHVFAARRLVPGWLERGEGYFLSTASAAGLLTQIGSAPYSVTKHAALAFAEWLAITHGEQGLKVSALCPQAVESKMTAGFEGGGVAGVDGMLSPEDVAQAVVDGLAAEQFLILPHPEVAEYFRRKADDYERWLRGMRRLQARFGPQM
jgi:NAD(P)-dependent dehydrogenase (short-subunit alcohol dehydrogenase family)